MPYDIVALGETLLRLTPPHLQRLGQNAQFDLHVGGCEGNTLSAMARLGLNCAWLSRLPNHEMGDLVRQFLRQHGVDVSHVCDGGDDRLGIYFYEPGRAPHRSQVIYDRADSAMARMQPEELPEALFRPGAARLFHTSGITLGLSDLARATAERALELARGAGIPCSLDVNYRQRLWTPEAARACLDPLLPRLDLLLIAERDIATLWPELAAESFEDSLRRLQSLAPDTVLVMTRGSAGAALLTPDGALHCVPAFKAIEVERLGGGDAFAAGFLSAWLEGEPHQKALQRGLPSRHSNMRRPAISLGLTVGSWRDCWPSPRGPEFVDEQWANNPVLLNRCDQIAQHYRYRRGGDSNQLV
ncbi:sugar kinase [Marinobacterium aestuariivivens]|uniref:Sugar kinase n=1 Tax=Marinobacterium aestuariivivens TaxID=1698799 RepID=A0ABW2A9D3_9GAMM